MHELSIAGNIVDAVSHEMKARQISRVEAIALKIGRMTDVDADSLAFGFEVITRDTPLQGTRLIIEHIPTAARCKSCGAEFDVADYLFLCPSCANTSVELIRGMELDIAYLEIDDENVSESDIPTP